MTGSKFFFRHSRPTNEPWLTFKSSVKVNSISKFYKTKTIPHVHYVNFPKYLPLHFILATMVLIGIVSPRILLMRYGCSNFKTSFRSFSSTTRIPSPSDNICKDSSSFAWWRSVVDLLCWMLLLEMQRWELSYIKICLKDEAWFSESSTSSMTYRE